MVLKSLRHSPNTLKVSYHLRGLKAFIDYRRQIGKALQQETGDQSFSLGSVERLRGLWKSGGISASHFLAL